MFLHMEYMEGLLCFAISRQSRQYNHGLVLPGRPGTNVRANCNHKKQVVKDKMRGACPDGLGTVDPGASRIL